jgi:prepilin peptidase CpaA
MAPLQIAMWAILGLALVISVVTDLLSRRILDGVTLPVLFLGLVLRGVEQGLGDLEHGLISGLVAAAAGTLLFLPGAWRGKLGWGDLKLVAAVGAVLGFPLVLWGLVFITLVGALQAVLTLLWHGAGWETAAGWMRGWARRLRLASESAATAPARHIPYGVAIAVGSFWAMWWHSARGAP